MDFKKIISPHQGQHNQPNYAMQPGFYGQPYNQPIYNQPYPGSPQQRKPRDENQQKTIDNIKANFDGFAAAPTTSEIENLLSDCNWDEDQAFLAVQSLFTEKKILLTLQQINDNDLHDIINKESDDQSIIEALNQKRDLLATRLLDDEMNRFKKTEANLFSQNETLVLEKSRLERKLSEVSPTLQATQQEVARLEVLASVDKQAHLELLAEKTKLITKLESNVKFLEQELSLIMNSETDSHDTIKNLKAVNQELKTEILEFHEAPFVKAPEKALFGDIITVRWRRAEGNPSEISDCIRLYDSNDRLVASNPIGESKISGSCEFLAPEHFGDYYFAYSIVTAGVFGMFSEEEIHCRSNVIRVGPTYVIVEESTGPETLTVKIQRETGLPCFSTFHLGMFFVGGLDAKELHVVKEDESVVFHITNDDSLFNYEFKLFGQLDDGLLFQILSEGHASFQRNDKKRRIEIRVIDDEEDRDMKRRRNIDEDEDNHMDTMETRYHLEIEEITYGRNISGESELI